jgi:hypothetical protein
MEVAMGERFMAIGLALAALVLGACGDDASGAEACKEGMEAGQFIACMCGEKNGIQTCGDDGNLSDCNCVAPDGGFPLPTGGTGGIMTMTGGTGGAGGTGGTGGTGATGAEDDAGVVAPVDSGTDEPAGPPSDGSELSTCSVPADCDDGLVCYTGGGALPVGYCTSSCTTATADTDCSDGATCSNDTCRYSCMGADDDAACPMFMECIQIAGITFRCGYPEDVDVPAGDGVLYSACSGDTDCAEGLRCNNYGHCTHGCEDATDCEAATTGDLDPTCSEDMMLMGGPVIEGNGCRFECDLQSDPDLCPDGLTCTPAGIGMARCTSL